jgi:AcrR family transcriptional regulator
MPPHTAASPWAAPEQRSRTRDALRADKRAAVLRTAARLFNEKGFHATSLDEVAERLHVTKPTLYHYVHSKDEILFECVKAGLQMMREAIAARSAAGGSTLEQLEAGMRAYTRIVTQDFGMCLIRIGEDPLPEAGRSELRRLKREIDLEFRRLIEACIAEGSIRPVDAKLAAFTLAGALSWVGRWYRPGGTLGAEQIADTCCDLLLSGLRPAPVPPTASPPARRRKAPASRTPRGDKP